MASRGKDYDRVIFPPKVINEALRVFDENVKEKDKDFHWVFEIERERDRWTYDTKDEFFAEYRCGFLEAIISNFSIVRPSLTFRLFAFKRREVTGTSLEICLPDKSSIQAVYEVFERNVDTNKVPLPPRPPLNKRVKVFIGHGRSSDWRDLKDHLQDVQGFDVVAYEVGSRAGLSIKEVLEQMLTESSFALLVLTPEDEDSEGRFHARENVIHELGLFQGKLGFERAIAVMAEGVKKFSNIDGLNPISYSKNIRETFGDVLATIKREFDKD